MATDVTDQNTTVTGLVSGIIDDTQRLFKQQAELLKADIKKDIKEAKEAGIAMLAAGALLGSGGMLLLFTLVHLLHWAFPDLPLWGCFGIVGGILALAGGVVYFRGQEKLDNLNPLPENSAQALQENLQWKTNPK
jgi:hypothetical protein